MRIKVLIDDIGGGILFLGQIILTAIRTPAKIDLTLEQIYKVTAQSFATTAMAGFFVGAIMTIQFTMQLNEFSALEYLGGISTSATLREVGPLLIAFMLSGKVGAFTAAELGTMRVTEQIDAIRCLGANPIREIIVPRFFGIVTASFVLLSGGLVLSIIGGLLMGGLFAEVSFQEYVRHIPTLVTMPSIFNGLFKSFVFAFLIATICTYRGYTATGGAKGVGKAVLQTAVACMIAIVLSDWVTTVFTDTALTLIRGE